MNTRKGRVKFKNLKIILESGFTSKIRMGKLVEKLHPEKDAVVQWHTQAGNITPSFKVKIDFILPALSAINYMTWKCHANESAKGIYDMILGKIYYQD